MPRVHTVLKNRKPQTCGKCRKEIGVGEGYKHWSFRYGGKSVRCLTCKIRRSELTQSGYFAQVYDAQDDFHDTVGELDRTDWEGFRDSLIAAAENVRDVADGVKGEYEDALAEWEHGNSMLEEKVEMAEQWYEELDSAISDVDGEEPDLPDEPDEDADEEEKEEYQSERESAIETFVEDIANKIEEAVDGCELC